MDSRYTTNLPHQVYTPQQVRTYEPIAAKHCGVSMLELMARAGVSVADWLKAHFTSKHKVLVVTGIGNNAGDGFVVANELMQAGYEVSVWPLFSMQSLQGDSLVMAKEYQQNQGHFERAPTVSDFDIIVDAVFGSGMTRPFDEQIANHFAALNRAAAIRVSIDVPSGVNAHSGQVYEHAFNAHHTLTLIALKQGMLSGKAKIQCGTLWFNGLGVADEFNHLCSTQVKRAQYDTMMAKRPIRHAHSHKGDAGHVLVIAGDEGMAGAARLAAEAALRSGAGLVSVATRKRNVSSVINGRYELMVHGVEDATQLTPLLSKADVVVIGPGLGQMAWGQSMWQCVLNSSANLAKVVDADALNLLAKKPKALANAVITPHPKEAARLLASSAVEVEQNRFEALEKLQKKYNATVLLKGPGSLIGHESRVTINSSGNNALSSAGMGDVLAGVIGALIAQGCSPFEAASLAAYVHGLSAEQLSEQGSKGLLASDLFTQIQAILG